mgnify:CR=1 FL=1
MGYRSYVVSADIETLLNDWAKRQGFTLPPADFFCDLRLEFTQLMREIFPSFELLAEAELTAGVANLVKQSGLPQVSLDGVYFQSNARLDLTRCVSSDNQDCGLRRRSGTISLLAQVRAIKASGLKNVVLVDDVVFSGELMTRVIVLLERIGVRVGAVCAGIGISEGTRRIEKLGRPVCCVRYYEEVIDQVCERDFYPGIPFSGRLLVGSDNVGVPYLLPFGRPGKWASIPARHQLQLSRHCLSATAAIFSAIERYSNREVLCSHVGRRVLHMPEEGRFVGLLEAFL